MPTTLNQGGRVDADAKEDTSARLVGTRVGKYEIVGIVGKGGMGCVYEALNTSIQKRVALKCIDHELAKNEEAYTRFHREALAASAIESPHIVQIFDAGKTEDGVPFIVMELLRGADLGVYLKRVGRLELNDVLHIAVHALKGLHHAHGAGIIHRDLKPDNVFLVDRDEEPVFVKLLDFGVSKISRASDVPLETLTRQGSVVGTPFYMSPEQAQAFPDVDTRTDIYSLGALLFESLAGRTPHEGKSYEQVIVNICMKDVDDVRTYNPSVPGGVAAVIAKALSREREDRYETARDMLNALIDSAPESFKQSTPSSKLRGVSLGGVEGSIAHTPMVISPPLGSRVPSGLADTVHLEDSGNTHAALRQSGVSPKSERVDTLPSDAEETVKSVIAQPVKAVSVAPPPRRWALAAAPGVALLLALVLYLSFDDEEAAAPNVKSEPARKTVKDEPVEPSDMLAPPPVADADPPAATAAPSAPSASVSAKAAKPIAVKPTPVAPVPALKPLPNVARPAPQDAPPPQQQQPTPQPPKLELQPH